MRCCTSIKASYFPGSCPLRRPLYSSLAEPSYGRPLSRFFQYFLQSVSFAAAGVGFLKISFVTPNPACLPSSTISICHRNGKSHRGCASPSECLCHNRTKVPTVPTAIFFKNASSAEKGSSSIKPPGLTQGFSPAPHAAAARRIISRIRAKSTPVATQQTHT